MGVRNNKDLHISGRIKAEKGITLIELLVVVAIIGILVVIGIPGIGRLSSDYSVRSCATDLLQNMRLARAMAIKENRRYLITFDTANNIYRVGFSGNSDNDLLDTVDGFGTGPVRVVKLNDQCGDGIVFGSETNTGPDTPSSCPDCKPVSNTASFGYTSSPVREQFNPDGSLSYLGSAFMKHSGQGYTYMVRVSYQSGNINLWRWDGDKNNSSPAKVNVCSFPRRQCGWTELR